MTEEQQTLLLIRGQIASQTEGDQLLIKKAADELRAVVAKYPPGYGAMAVALLGAELASEE